MKKTHCPECGMEVDFSEQALLEHHEDYHKPED